MFILNIQNLDLVCLCDELSIVKHTGWTLIAIHELWLGGLKSFYRNCRTPSIRFGEMLIYMYEVFSFVSLTQTINLNWFCSIQISLNCRLYHRRNALIAHTVPLVLVHYKGHPLILQAAVDYCTSFVSRRCFWDLLIGSFVLLIEW